MLKCNDTNEEKYQIDTQIYTNTQIYKYMRARARTHANLHKHIHARIRTQETHGHRAVGKSTHIIHIHHMLCTVIIHHTYTSYTYHVHTSYVHITRTHRTCTICIHDTYTSHEHICTNIQRWQDSFASYTHCVCSHDMHVYVQTIHTHVH